MQAVTSFDVSKPITGWGNVISQKTEILTFTLRLEWKTFKQAHRYRDVEVNYPPCNNPNFIKLNEKQGLSICYYS
jgi:hypothetical protein